MDAYQGTVALWSVACKLRGCGDVPQEYYSSILKKLKQVGASSRQTDFYV